MMFPINTLTHSCTHASTHARTHARTHAHTQRILKNEEKHNNNYVNVSGQLVENDRRLGEVQSKTSFIGNIVYGMIFGPNYIMLNATFQITL